MISGLMLIESKFLPKQLKHIKLSHNLPIGDYKDSHFDILTSFLTINISNIKIELITLEIQDTEKPPDDKEEK